MYQKFQKTITIRTEQICNHVNVNQENHVISWNEAKSHCPWVGQDYKVDSRCSQDPTGQSRCHWTETRGKM